MDCLYKDVIMGCGRLQATTYLTIFWNVHKRKFINQNIIGRFFAHIQKRTRDFSSIAVSYSIMTSLLSSHTEPSTLHGWQWIHVIFPGWFIPFWWQTAAAPAIFASCSQTTVLFPPRVTFSVPHICLSKGFGAPLLMLHYDGRHQGSLAHQVCPARKLPATHFPLWHASYSATSCTHTPPTLFHLAPKCIIVIRGS